MLRLQWQI